MSQPKDSSKPPPEGVLEALRLLTAAARKELAAHPWRHLVDGQRIPLEVRLTLPLHGRDEDIDLAAREAFEGVADSIHGAVTHRALFQPGHVFCQRCASAECEHSLPGNCREIFAGYGPTGLPRFRDLGQWLLERKDPRINDLYDHRTALLTAEISGRELMADLLSAYRDRDLGFELHGQVVAGWYRLPDAAGQPHPMAFTFQLLSSRPRQGRRRFGLNVVALGPNGENLREVFQRTGSPPWREALAWAREALQSLEAGARKKGRTRATGQRLEGILSGLARRLARYRRAKDRRTHHAQQRHEDRDRPTEMALADFRRASSERLLLDARRETLVVLGDRGRTHFFSLEGKHVTSVRYSPATIEKRQRQGQWRPAQPEEAALVAKGLGALREAEPEASAAAP